MLTYLKKNKTKKPVSANLDTSFAFPRWQHPKQGGSWGPAGLYDFLGIAQALLVMDVL